MDSSAFTAAQLHVAKGAMAKTVDRLERRGLVVRQQDSEDRRTVYAALTHLAIRTSAAAH